MKLLDVIMGILVTLAEDGQRYLKLHVAFAISREHELLPRCRPSRVGIGIGSCETGLHIAHLKI